MLGKEEEPCNGAYSFFFTVLQFFEDDMPRHIFLAVLTSFFFVLAGNQGLAEVTPCDELASHPDDPDRVTPGIERADIDFAASEAACRKAVQDDADNVRSVYQLGRVLFYQGKSEEAIGYVKQASDAGYRQATFVLGYIYITGSNVDQDVCGGAELVRQSAIAGRRAGQVGFPYYVLAGIVDECSVQKDWDEMLGFLETAAPDAQGYYETLLVETLTSQVKQKISASTD